MVPASLMLEHALALLLVWNWAFLAGYPFLCLLRIPVGFVGAVLLGVAYWAAVLFLLPFAHGLDVAALVAIVASVLAWVRARRVTAGSRFPSLTLRALISPSTLLLFLGCLAYATLPLTNYVPPGMDASMHTTAARLIATSRGLPADCSPMAPTLPFPAVNAGLPTLAAVASRWGVSAESAMLACEHLTFSLVILSAYLLLRVFIRRTPAAVIAVVVGWGARGLQDTVNWGGFPTVAGLAVGLFAARMVIDLSRRPNWWAALPLGLVVASLPLLHGVSAAGWVYVVGPAALAFGLRKTTRVSKAMGVLALAAGVCLLILAAYLVAGHVGNKEGAAEWTRTWQADYAPKGEGWALVSSLRKNLVWATGPLAGCGMPLVLVVLLVRGRWSETAAVGGLGLAITLLVLNSRVWLLPGSILLYPERVAYWLTPLSALALALAWRRLPQGRGGRILATVLLILAFAEHCRYYQRVALRPVVHQGHYEALRWSAQNLDPARDYVDSEYLAAGAYLPCVAGVPTTGAHVHFLDLEAVRAAFHDRPTTVRFVLRAKQPEPPGRVVFANADVVIVAP